MRRHAATVGLDDAVLVNTCAVTASAVRQAKQAIRKARRDHPGATIVVTGCAAQISPDTFSAMPEVDHIIGNHDKLAPEAFADVVNGDAERVAVNDIMSVRETAGQLIDGFANRTRAYVQVQNGCDHRCTFCIIPFGRGPSRSCPAGEVVRQIQLLVDQGYKEVVLTGVDITSYGQDLAGPQNLGRLVRQILHKVPELRRLRLSSIDQVEVDRELITAIAEEERLMPHFHLSMQSGSDIILKRMKRRHLRNDAIEFCSHVRTIRPDVVFGADLIAGFPTETETAFQDTLDLVDQCGLTYLHVFPFSPRDGTPAARMPQVQGSQIKARASCLRDKAAQRLAAFLDRQIGQDVEVLIERKNLGRTPQFAEVLVKGDTDLLTAGQLVRAHVSRRSGTHLEAELIH